jgi:uncharacterized protein YndB with AHSA1/START domain
MTTILHDTFTLERTFDASVAEVWRVWTDPELRPRWFHGPEGWTELERTIDFRVGGSEILRGRMSSGMESKFVSRFHIIAPERHIVSTYDMAVGSSEMSVTLATLELAAAAGSTRLRYTEQGVFFDGNLDSPKNRKHGTSWHLDNLVEVVRTK